MKFMADENFPRQAVAALREAGFEVAWITEECPGTADENVLSLCAAKKRILLTFDKDFGELAFRRGLAAECGIVLFRITPQNPDEISATAIAALKSALDWRGNFSVVTRLGIRVRALL
jgi:predicted nuclease of predicted toxin-antitoxin system